jgi:DNA-binding HxlR family transcriptional regulator
VTRRVAHDRRYLDSPSDRLRDNPPPGPSARSEDHDSRHGRDDTKRTIGFRNGTELRPPTLHGVRAALDPDLFADCAVHESPMRVGDKWTSKIIICLRDGPRRFTELRVPLTGITAKVLTESLRALERDGFVTRTAYPEHPPRVEYELTPFGHTLFEPMRAFCEWSARHLPELAAARDYHDLDA